MYHVALRHHLAVGGQRPLSYPARHFTEELNQLRRVAGRNCLIRFCPTCQSPIIKNGGCNNMRCVCGARFRWNEARPLRPCRHCHRVWDEVEGSVLSRAITQFQTCRHCARSAHVAKAGLRTVAAVATVPVAAAGVGLFAGALAVAVGIAAVPAVIFGPMAVIYEPIRRLRKKDTNPLTYAAASGLAGVGLVCMACTGYESD